MVSELLDDVDDLDDEPEDEDDPDCELEYEEELPLVELLLMLLLLRRLALRALSLCRVARLGLGDLRGTTATRPEAVLGMYIQATTTPPAYRSDTRTQLWHAQLPEQQACNHNICCAKESCTSVPSHFQEEGQRVIAFCLTARYAFPTCACTCARQVWGTLNSPCHPICVNFCVSCQREPLQCKMMLQVMSELVQP